MRSDPIRSEDAPDVVAEINVTPLTDIFLVLLVIFMVTSTAIVQQGEKVNLPGAASGQPLDPGVSITATADGRIEIDGRTIGIDALPAALEQAIGADRGRPVVVRGDRSVSLERLVQILSAARSAGATRVAIATRPEGRAGK